MRSAAVGRRLNLPPSYVLIHRVSVAGIGVLCQLECEGRFRDEVLRWMPGYFESTDSVPDVESVLPDVESALPDVESVLPDVESVLPDPDDPDDAQPGTFPVVH
jgi:hypothetical protein